MKTCFKELDKLINGLTGGELITIAGRPAMGKTTLSINIVNNVVGQVDKKILFFTLESTKEMLCKRFTSKNVEIIDNVCYIEDIKSKCNEIQEQGLALVVVDYFQLISSYNNSDNKLEERVYLSQQLKSLALELNVPIIVVSQLTRELEQRNDKRPNLQDTVNTGLQQASDKIICLYSDEYYIPGRFIDVKKIELIIVKNCSGQLGTVCLKYDKDTMNLI